MRIKRVHLKNYKRFTELTIDDLPETTRLVVLVGPNGTGKSSVFDSFLLKSQASVNNNRLSGDRAQYYDKVSCSQNTHGVASRVDIEFHGLGEGEVGWRSAFQVRSAYRNESDFRIEELRQIVGLRLVPAEIQGVRQQRFLSSGGTHRWKQRRGR